VPSSSTLRRLCSTALAILGTLLLVATTVRQAHADEPERSSRDRFYLLTFDRYGQLSNPYERELALKELKADPDVSRILIIAYGWANDGDASLGAYRELIDDLLLQERAATGAGRTVIFGIGWDSSQTGFRKLANDLVPLPVVADAVAFVPDRVLFPFSFWSKAAMADRIGFGGLRQALNEILGAAYPDPKQHPPIYLIGHSFGTRILSGLIKNQFGLIRAGTEPFDGAEHVRGALWIQPALVAPNLPYTVDYPLILTQNEHDHANGILFPIANVFVNAYAFTMFEGVIQNRLFDAFEGAADTARGSVVKAGSSLLERTWGSSETDAKDTEAGRNTSDSGDSTADDAGNPVPLPARAYRATRRTGAELLAIPAALAFSIAATPIQYLYTQWDGLRRSPVDHVMDTLAQVPILEIGTDALGRAIGRDVPWGRASKGFLALGGLHESMGRVVYPTIGGVSVPAPISYKTFRADADPSGCGSMRCTGVQVIDLSDEIGRGLVGELRDPLVLYSIGWFDPIGMHERTRDPEIRWLISHLLEPALTTADQQTP